MAAGDQFFLPEADAADDTKFRAAQRPGCSVVPLIDGIATFKAMEVAIASARKSVHIAVWTAKADLELQAKDDVNKALKASGRKGKGVTNWQELFAAVAALGREVRILMSDFDPILQNALHENCWRAYRALRAAREAKTHNLQVMCSRHDAKFPAPFLINAAVVSPKLAELIAKLNAMSKADGISRINTMPGLWPFVDYDKPTKTFSESSATHLVWPASHHQKICIVDGEIGFCGGLDPQPGRVDTPAHTGTWHDTHVQVEGALASDLERNFVARWNAEGTIFNTFVDDAATAGKTLNAEHVTPITATPNEMVGPIGVATGQLLRTVASTTVSAMVPVNVRNDIEEAFQKAIGQAQSFIYIENQYVRDEKLVTWLSATPATVAVILVLPIAPEEVAQAGGPDPVTQKGIFLEDKVVKDLQTNLGARFGAFSMVQTRQASEKEKNHQTNSAGSFQVYVHSKTLIVDDQFAMIGSANTNPRSHLVDTEANIGWYEPTGVKALRLALWNEMLGKPGGMETWAPSTFVSNWKTIAAANAATKKQAQRKGFVIPHDITKFPGADNPAIPKEYTELTDQDPVGVALV